MDGTKLFNLIVTGVEKKLKSNVTPAETRYLRAMFNKIDLTIFKDSPIADTYKVLVEHLHTALSKRMAMSQPVNIHEILSQMIGSEPESMAALDQTTLLKPTMDLTEMPNADVFTPAGGFGKIYMFLDRKYRDRSLDGNDGVRWCVTSVHSNSDHEITVKTSALIRDVVKVKTFPFRFPNTPHIGTELAVEFVELNSQAYIMSGTNKRFHFIFGSSNPNNDSTILLQEHGNSVCEFVFDNPIMEIPELTIRFSNPCTNLHLDPDLLYATLTADGTRCKLTFTTEHRCISGDLITINNVPMIGENAHVVQHSNTELWVDVDVSNVQLPLTPVEVYLEAKRFMLRVELTYLKGAPPG